MTYEEVLKNIDAVEDILIHNFGGFPYTKEEELLLITLDKARKALEKQIPKKCKKFIDTCTCGHKVYPHMKHCDICGQSLDWSDDE